MVIIYFPIPVSWCNQTLYDNHLVCKLNISYVMLNLKLLHVSKQLNVMSFETLVFLIT